MYPLSVLNRSRDDPRTVWYPTDEDALGGIHVEYGGATMMSRERPRDAVPRETPVPPLVVLAIDRDDDLGASYAYALLGMGFRVTMAGASLAYDNDLHGERPDVIVADTAPDSGYDWRFVETITSDPRTRDVAVVVLVADISAATCGRATREGCAAVCLKGCAPDVLASGIRSVLRARGAGSPQRERAGGTRLG